MKSADAVAIGGVAICDVSSSVFSRCCYSMKRAYAVAIGGVATGDASCSVDVADCGGRLWCCCK